MPFLLALLATLGLAQAQAQAPDAASPLPDRIDRWMQSVVLLVTGPSWCSGVVIDDSGTVATAYHCIASGQRVEIRLRGGDVYMGRTIAAAPRDDLALVEVPGLAGKVPGLPLRDETLRQGERLYGLGHPFAPVAGRTPAMEGMLLWSVTEGIVSAVGDRLIQTDAALNPGNSGGPVVDESGQVVGITSRKLTGDNIAFLSSVKRLRALQADPVAPKLIGGQVSFGLSSLIITDQHASPTLELVGSVILRDRVVLSGALGLDADARGLAMERGSSWAPEWELGLGLRQRFGRGSWSTAMDLTGGLMGTSGYIAEFDVDSSTWLVRGGFDEISPTLGGRLYSGGLGMRVVMMPLGRGGLISNAESQAAAREATRRNNGFGVGPGEPVWMLAIDLDLPGVIATF